MKRVLKYEGNGRLSISYNTFNCKYIYKYFDSAIHPAVQLGWIQAMRRVHHRILLPNIVFQKKVMLESKKLELRVTKFTRLKMRLLLNNLGISQFLKCLISTTFQTNTIYTLNINLRKQYLIVNNLLCLVNKSCDTNAGEVLLLHITFSSCNYILIK